VKPRRGDIIHQSIQIDISHYIQLQIFAENPYILL